jgi:ribosomal protein S18 acetylase RimI-like enzyme
MEIAIRKAEPTDAKNLAVLKQQVWVSTYATEGLVDEISGYVIAEYSLEKTEKWIADKNKWIFMVTVDEGVVGCAEISLLPQRPMDKVEPCPEISSLYILERFQGKGIGKQLLVACLKKVELLGHHKAWLSVYHKNEKAIGFYEKQDFENVGEIDFQIDKNKYKNFVMLKNLKIEK